MSRNSHLCDTAKEGSETRVQKKMALRGCCFCFDLQNGSKFIGFCLLVYNFIIMFWKATTIGVSLMEGGRFFELHVILDTVECVLCIAGIVYNSLLVHGARTEREDLLLAWLINGGVGLGLGLIMSIVVTVMLLVNLIHLPLIYTVWLLATYPLGLYFWAVVWYHYKELKHKDSGYEIHKTVPV